MRNRLVTFITFAAVVLGAAALCQTSPHPPEMKPGITQGPASIPLGGGEAKLELPKAFTYCDANAARELLSSARSPVPPDLVGLIYEENASVDWYAFISYKSVGYISDDDAADALKDGDHLLEQLKEKSQAAYAAMPAGSQPMPVVIGWYKAPAYDSEKHVLTMAALLQQPGEADQTVNFTTAVLGRHGIMAYAVIGPRADAAHIASKLAQLNPRIHFEPGNDYASWQEADGKSGLALTGLITGGAATAAAAKTGLLAKFGGLLLACLLALKKAFIGIIAAIGGVLRWIASRAKRQAGDPAVSKSDGPAGT